MKKLLKWMSLLSCFFLVFSVTACGKDDAPDNTDDTEQTCSVTLDDVNQFLNGMDMGNANHVQIIPFNHVNGPKLEWKFYALVNFEADMFDYVKYQVTFISCTCRSNTVNYWSTAYVELTKPESMDPNEVILKTLSFDKDIQDEDLEAGEHNYTAGFWGDSTPIMSGNNIVATYDKYTPAEETLTVEVAGKNYRIEYKAGAPYRFVSGSKKSNVVDNKVTINEVEYTLNLDGSRVLSITDGENVIETESEFHGIKIEGREGLEDGWYNPTIKYDFIPKLIGKTHAEIDQWKYYTDMNDPELTAFVGASVSTNNIIRIVQAMMDHHVERYL